MDGVNRGTVSKLTQTRGESCLRRQTEAQAGLSRPVPPFAGEQLLGRGTQSMSIGGPAVQSALPTLASESFEQQ